jgi:hypothetical protein
MAMMMQTHLFHHGLPRSKPTVWDGDPHFQNPAGGGFSVLSPPRGIATGTPIFANAPCGVENLELKEKGLNF